MSKELLSGWCAISPRGIRDFEIFEGVRNIVVLQMSPDRRLDAELQRFQTGKTSEATIPGVVTRLIDDVNNVAADVGKML